MKQALSALCLAALSACTSAGDSSLQSRFTRERPTLSCFEGPTSEPSCSGTSLTVFLNGGQVRHLDWTIEMSTRFIHREYFFDGDSPRLVVETIHAKPDPPVKPRLLSNKHYRLDTPQPDAYQKELLDHVRFLMDDFKKHRKDFINADSRST